MPTFKYFWYRTKFSQVVVLFSSPYFWVRAVRAVAVILSFSFSFSLSIPIRALFYCANFSVAGSAADGAIDARGAGGYVDHCVTVPSEA